MSSTTTNAGLGMSLYYSTNIGMDINIESTTLYGNTAQLGANLFISVVDTVVHYTININNLNSTKANTLFLFPASRRFTGQIVASNTMGAGYSMVLVALSCSLVPTPLTLALPIY